MSLKIVALLIFLPLFSSCQTADTREKMVGGPCEDCDALLDYKLFDKELKSRDTLPGFEQYEPKIRMSGTVFKSDKVTPAPGIILYIYHTNREGIYKPGSQAIGSEKRHGQHRTWLKTDQNGYYEFYTFRPAAYPNGREQEHIHIYVKEPGKTPYYLDSYIFTDDPLLTDQEIKSLENRGGTGLIELKRATGILHGERDIILGLNIPNYQ